jgi:hypothetical protein
MLEFADAAFSVRVRDDPCATDVTAAVNTTVVLRVTVPAGSSPSVTSLAKIAAETTSPNVFPGL